MENPNVMCLSGSVLTQSGTSSLSPPFTCDQGSKVIQ